MPQSLSAVYIHLVFSTKDRRPWLRDRSLRQSLHAYVGSMSKQLDCPALIAGVSQSNLEQITRYIGNQENHHTKMSFQEELPALPRSTIWSGTSVTFGISGTTSSRLKYLRHRFPRVATQNSGASQPLYGFEAQSLWD